jgi:hypothetical protein
MSTTSPDNPDDPASFDEHGCRALDYKAVRADLKRNGIVERINRIKDLLDEIKRDFIENIRDNTNARTREQAKARALHRADYLMSFYREVVREGLAAYVPLYYDTRKHQWLPLTPARRRAREAHVAKARRALRHYEEQRTPADVPAGRALSADEAMRRFGIHSAALEKYLRHVDPESNVDFMLRARARAYDEPGAESTRIETRPKKSRSVRKSRSPVDTARRRRKTSHQ